jgi:hypothetical protein
MTSIKVLSLCCPVALLTFLSPSQPQASDMAESLQERIYMAVNIWFERPDKILSTNYHRGTIIPAGTEVNNVKLRGNEIVFTVVSGLPHTMLHVKRHSTITLDELFHRYFSTENVLAEGGKFSKLTNMEKDNVRAGTLSVGMSKDAVLMAYGYPPSHRTPSPSENTWIYWNHRMGKVLVYFAEDNKVKQITPVTGP